MGAKNICKMTRANLNSPFRSSQSRAGCDKAKTVRLDCRTALACAAASLCEWENARRKEAYRKAVGAALKAADPLKAAQDHRLRCQIRKLKSLETTLGEKEAKVCGLLATL